MKSIGIVICNYNKCNDILKCIQSVFESETQDFDLFVVDNASTDASVASIREQFGDRVELLINHENLGGSGGFNTGIRKVVETGYEYLMCLDNDVIVDHDAIWALYSFLKNNPEVGMVGSKVYHMTAPEYIQQFGLNIDFENVTAKTLYADVEDSEEIPEVVYCDTVAACSVMLPVEVVRKVGSMPEDNFIYWDDMEWGYQVKSHGYKVAAYGESRVLHAMGAINNKNASFMNYYIWRNYTDFFMRYTEDDKLEQMSVKLLSNLFDKVYESIYRMDHDVAKAILFAYQDAITNTRGKAKPGRIIQNTIKESELYKLIQCSESYWMEEEDQHLDNLIRNAKPSIVHVENPDKAQLRIKKCSNIMELRDYSLTNCYIDKNYNVAANSSDIELIKNYTFSLELFLYMNQTQFLDAARMIRKERSVYGSKVSRQPSEL